MPLALNYCEVMQEFYAHSMEKRPPEDWQKLIVHLANVAELAGGFASFFGAAELGRIAGFLHDLGKYDRDFQLYLLRENGLLPEGVSAPARVDHSTSGAKTAFGRFDPLINGILAYVIAGHHAGLPDYSAADGASAESCLSGRLDRYAKKVPLPDGLLERMPAPSMPAGFRPDPSGWDMAAFQTAFLARMLFSCLVDADWLDTEAFCDARNSLQRSSVVRPDINEIMGNLAGYMHGFAGSSGPVNERRGEVLRDGLSAAGLVRGIFSLTVPTGGGKTLSSLSFALRHAQKNRMRRVIYVIPFTSIIEQTADVFRKAVGVDAVLEHHSNFDAKDRENDDSRQKFLSDNWDFPLIVTTGVQFYESLFSAHTSRCRKLHNIAGSVLIFDEAQTLPVEYLAPCLAALRELVRNYGCSVVLCTATQPALEKSETFPIGFAPGEVREIVRGREELYLSLKRTEISVVERPLSLSELSARLASDGCSQSLCIVNKRRHARDLYRALKEAAGDGGVYHLSALMCAAHRTRVLDEIRAVLEENRGHPESKKPCRVVSTQLVEAGVDVDFPVVYRAMAGVDSIAQAAGRCNREGRLSEMGRVFVFRPAEEAYKLKSGYLCQTAETAEGVLRHFGDPLSLDCVKKYFEAHYQKQSRGNTWDAKGILGMSKLTADAGLEAQFRAIEENFNLIPGGQFAIVVPYGDEGRKLCARIRDERIPLNLADYRLAQRYSVSVYRNDFDSMQKAGPGCLGTFRDGRFYVLVNPEAYSEEFGLDPSRGALMEVGRGIC
jgi:CRISPR-associated endonuclease/helicase Cas3